MEGVGRRVAALLLVVTAACSGDDNDDGERTAGTDPAPPPTAEPQLVDSVEDFYAVPDPIPVGEHGDLVRYQLVADPPEGVTQYRVMYLSETVAGDPTVVTGVVTVPEGAPPEGGWKLVSHAHGSTGLDDPCSPSVNLGTDSFFAIEIAFLSTLAPTKGYVIASSDYEGLGGPGGHPFLVGESEGRGVLDVALAARQLPDVEIGQQTGIAGYSQGGHAALWANQIAADWAPSLDVVGTMAGAPASELVTMYDDAPPEVREQLLVGIVTGLAAGYPDADPSEILTPAGLDVSARYETECPPLMDVDPTVALLQANPTTTEPWSSLLEENTPGAVAAPTPLLLVHSAEDANVPIATSATLLERLCGVGQVAERRVLATGDHVAAAVPAYEQALDWFDSLMAGDEPTSSCP